MPTKKPNIKAGHRAAHREFDKFFNQTGRRFDRDNAVHVVMFLSYYAGFWDGFAAAMSPVKRRNK